MRAALITEFGPVESVRVRDDVATPSPGAGEVLVRTTVAGVNFADAGIVMGSNQRARPPFVPGVEAAGAVESVGEGVEGLSVGQRVVYWNPLPGAFAEFAAVPAWRVVPLPEGIGDEVAVALMVQGATAHYLVTDTFGLGAGQSCLVYAAAGGVGHLLVQIAAYRETRVIAVVGSEEKAMLARRLGAETVINRGERDVLEGVREATDGAGVDVVYDSVGAATIEQSLLSTKRRGTCVLYGGSSGPVRMLDTTLMQQAGSIFFTRPGLGDYLRDGEEYRRRMGELFEWHREGWLTPHSGGEWELDGVSEALSEITSGKSLGKLLLRVSR